MQKQTIEYTANYGKFRNQFGNWLYQQASQQPIQEHKFRKKQYPPKKCQIQKYKMLNSGETYLPQVSDLILDVSDIKGTHTDTIKSEAVRNRLIAKEMREHREKLARTEEKNAEIKNNQRLIVRDISLPKPSYHYMQRGNNPERVKTEEDQIKSRSQMKIITMPDELEDARQRYCNEYFRNVNTTLPAKMSEPGTPHSYQKPLSKNGKNCMMNKKMSLIETGQHTLDSELLRDKKDIKSAIQYRIKVFNQGAGPKSSAEASNILTNALKNRRLKINNEIMHHRLSRINPTFLSFGSQYLYDQNNYLANYRNKSVIG